MIVVYKGRELPSRRGKLCKIVKSEGEDDNPLYTLLFNDGRTHMCMKEYTVESFTNYYEEVNNRGGIQT